MRFSEIPGNEYAKQRIRNLVDENKIPHAILISGMAGIPKLSLARATAQYIHCGHRQNGDSCGVCPSCIQHQSHNHADLFYVFPVIKKNSKSSVSDDFIEEWREFLNTHKYESFERWLKFLENENAQPRIFVTESDSIIHKMSLTSYSSKYKVMIIWLPEKLMEECANKLLKIIEEPFPDSIFILVSDNPKEILPTIYSRTQHIELKKLSTGEIAQHLCSSFGVGMQDAMAIAATADGNIVAAEEALSLNSENKEFLSFFITLMRCAYIRDIKGLKNWSEDVNAMKREKIRRFLVYCCRMLRENFMYNLHITELNYLTNEEEQFSRKFSPFINERNVETMLYELSKAETDIQRNANPKMVLFDLSLKVTRIIKA